MTLRETHFWPSLTTFWIQIAVIIFVCEATTFYETEQALKKKILAGYDKTVPPKISANDSVTVTVQLFLQDIESLDVDKEILTTHVWLRTRWEDARLTWDPEDFSGVESLAINARKLWLPDLVPYNLAGSGFAYSDDYKVIVMTDTSTNTSVVSFIPHVRLQTRCPIDLMYYPFDSQTCKIKIGSWVYSGKTVMLSTNKYAPMDIDDVTLMVDPDGVWDITNYTAVINAKKYNCCAEEYYDYEATLTLRRHCHLNVHMLVGPSVCVSLAIPLIFVLPAVSSYKLILGGTLLVAETLMLNILTTSLPPSHRTAPVIAMYLLANIVLLCLALACSTVITHCWNRAKRSAEGVPAGLDKVCLGILGRLLQVKRDDFIEGDVNLDHGLDDVSGSGVTSGGQTSDDTVAMVKQYTRLVAPAEWRQLSVVLDRFCFILFSIITVVIMAALVRYSY